MVVPFVHGQNKSRWKVNANLSQYYAVFTIMQSVLFASSTETLVQLMVPVCRYNSQKCWTDFDQIFKVNQYGAKYEKIALASLPVNAPRMKFFNVYRYHLMDSHTVRSRAANSWKVTHVCTTCVCYIFWLRATKFGKITPYKGRYEPTALSV